MPDKVSVIMPAYDAVAFVEDAVRSVLAQTHRDVELIAVDDNSSDGTGDMLAELAREDDRVQVIRCARNGGPGHARNLAIDAASGRWIALLDADDIYAAEHIELLLQGIRRYGCDMIAGNQLLRVYPSGETLGLAFPALAESRELSLEELVTSGTCADLSLSFGYLKPLISADFIAAHGIRYDEKYRVGEDFLFYFECMRQRARCRLIPDASYVYRRRLDSLTLSATSNYRTLSDLTTQMIRQAEGSLSAQLTALLRARKRYLDEQSEYHETVTLLRRRRLLQATRRVLANPRIGARIAGKAIEKISARSLRSATG
jgi:glycosyltransferase involved in cell wall biosynthesis